MQAEADGRNAHGRQLLLVLTSQARLVLEQQGEFQVSIRQVVVTDPQSSVDDCQLPFPAPTGYVYDGVRGWR
jgi:hypothetical protein